MKEDPSLSIEFKTYGCKVNTYDTGLLQKRFTEKGVKNLSDRKIHILNTCAVTAEATKDAIRYSRKLKRDNPEAMVVVTGCGAQVDTEKYELESEADLVVANSHKTQIEDLIREKLTDKDFARVHRSNIFEKSELEEEGGLEEGRSRAFLKIQDGCNSFCTYCVIPFARGKSRSIPIPKLVDKVNELYRQGFRETIITGIHIADYASLKNVEKGPRFVSARGKQNTDRYYFLEDLVEALLAHTDMPRFRISSLEPEELSTRLLDLYDNPRMCPHFHMSIQSACSKTLKDMKRKYDAKSVEKSLRAIYARLPDAYVGMDVIVGFPGETEEDFLETYKRLDELPWTRIHVFSYSDRPGTKAMAYENKLDQKTKTMRAKRLRALSKDRYAELANEQIGQQKDSLMLSKYKKSSQALTRDNWQIRLANISKEQSDKLSPGEYPVRITGFDSSNVSRMDGVLVGELVHE